MKNSLRSVAVSVAALLFSVLTVSAAAPIDRYAKWVKEHFGVSGAEFSANFSRVGPDADPDGDGLSNLAEYALGTDPMSHSEYPGAAVTFVESWGGYSLLALSTSVRTDDPNLIFIPQVSEDGGNWWPLLPYNVNSVPLDNFFAAQTLDGQPSGGMKAVQYAALPNSPLKNPQFIRLAIVRHAATTAAPGVAPETTIPAGGTNGNTAAPAAMARLFSTTPTIPGLLFTSQLSAAMGAELLSNAITLRGFAGSITVTAPPGLTLIVNGKPVEGSSAKVRAGNTLALKANTPGTPDQPVTYAVKFGDSTTAQWKVGGKQVPPVNVPAGTVSGYTPVSASVGQGGDANISLPITVSPGIAGMEPKLSISYNSGGGNGPLGIGFNLGGLFSISRTAANLAQDGFRGSLQINANDRFVLNGSRLISVTGEEGKNGTVYRTEIEEFSRIQSFGVAGSGPASWKVETKQGLIYTYGADTQSQVKLAGHDEVLVWSITSIEDTAGNQMWFSYDTSDAGSNRIARIDYTCRGGRANNPTKNHVDFIYEDRPDTRSGFLVGAPTAMSKRLKAVECYHDQQIVRRYELEYQQAEFSGSSQLFRVTEKGQKPQNPADAWLSFPPTVFEWDQNGNANQVYSDITQVPQFSGMTFSRSPPSLTVMGDFAGTGRMGIMQIDDHGGPGFWLALGNKDGTFSLRLGLSEFTAADAIDSSGNTYYSRVRVGDFNGDGRSDVLQMTRNGVKNWLALAKADGTFDIRRGAQLGALYQVGQTGDFTNEVLSLDANGDGRTDIVVLRATSDARVFLSNGDGTFTEKDPGAAFKAFRIADGRATYNWVLPGDYNGDGLADILLLYYTGAHSLALNNGDGTFTVQKGSALGGIAGKSFSRSYCYITSGDFNNDGLTDVITFEDNDTAWIGFCRGDGTFTAPLAQPSLQGLTVSDSGSPYTDIQTGDLNGDGLPDVFHAYYSKSVYSFVAHAQGNGGFTVLKNGQMGALDNRSYDTGNPPSRIFIGDFDGDGRDDILDLRYGGSASWMVRSTGYDSNRIRKVTNGHLGATSFTYKPMTDSSVYSKGTSAQYPAINLQTPMYVVDSMTSRNGVDGNPDSASAGTPGTSRVSYSYSDVQVYLDGHGFQQAKMVTEVNETSGIVSKTWFGVKDGAGKDIPQLSGCPVKSEQSLLANGRVISSSTSSWTLQPRNSTPNHRTYFAFATSSVKRDFEINTGALVRVTTTTTPANGYDDHGNVLSTTSKTAPAENSTDADSFIDTTVNTWGDQTSGKWLIGRLMSSQVTRTAPGGYSDTRNSSFDYDFSRSGQLIKEVVEPEDSTAGITYTKTYHIDDYGNIDQSTETAWDGTGTASLVKSRSKYTIYGEDHRFIEKTRNDLKHEEITLHEPLLGQIYYQKGPNQIESRIEYDGFGRPIRGRRADGTETRTWHLRATPGINGAPARAVYGVTTQSSATPAQTVWYDVLDREIQRDAIGFDGRTISSRKVFNNRGEVVQTSDPFFAGSTPRYTLMQYDAISRILTETAPGNRITTTTYNGLTTTVQNPKEQGTAFKSSRTVTVAGKLAFSTDQKSNNLRYEYDGFGLLRKVIDDPAGNTTEMSYDKRGRRLSITEPNTGTAFTAYNGFGEIILETASDNQKKTHVYDSLSREILRIEPEGKTVWTYDTFDPQDVNDGIARKSIGKLLRVTYPGYQQDVTYDYLGRPKLVTTRIAGGIFNTSTGYDYTGRAETLSYPTGFAIRNVYNQYAHLAEVRDASSGSLYWKASAVNERGKIEEDSLGNGLRTRRGYDANTGRINSIRTGSSSRDLAEIQDLGFHFDAIGNLDSRIDLARGLSETFDLDELNRLTGTHLSGATTDTPDTTIGYDDLGDLTSRSEVGTLTYGGPGLLPSFTQSAGPHAVTKLTNRPNGAPDLRYGYTVRGNRARVDHYAKGKWVNDQRIAYNTANLPTLIIAGKVQSRFSYGPDRARFQQVQFVGGHKTLDRLYVGSLYEREKRGAVTRHVHYIPAGGGMIAIRQTEEGPGAFDERTLYLHKDHLGSIESISTATGALAEHLNYDTWGRRRTLKFEGGITTASYTSGTTRVPDTTPRGFTGHEMLDNVGLIHMNGRLYDPLTGRFLSADPIVQELDNLQNLNRYSYVLNNPLSLTDPSGFESVGFDFNFHFSQSDIDNAVRRSHANNPNSPIGSINIPPHTGIDNNLGRHEGGHNQSYGSAFTGTLLAGGSIGDAQRAGFSTSNQSAIDGNTIPPSDISWNDVVISAEWVVALPFGIAKTIYNRIFGVDDLKYPWQPGYSSFGEFAKSGLDGAIFGDNARLNYENQNPESTGHAGLLGNTMSLVYQYAPLGDTKRFQFEQEYGHNLKTLPGSASNRLWSPITTFFEGFGDLMDSAQLSGVVERLIPLDTKFPPFKGLRSGAGRDENYNWLRANHPDIPIPKW